MDDYEVTSHVQYVEVVHKEVCWSGGTTPHVAGRLDAGYEEVGTRQNLRSGQVYNNERYKIAIPTYGEPFCGRIR